MALMMLCMEVLAVVLVTAALLLQLDNPFMAATAGV